MDVHPRALDTNCDQYISVFLTDGQTEFVVWGVLTSHSVKFELSINFTYSGEAEGGGWRG